MFRLYSIIASPPFRFLVGPDRKLFTIHTALVIHHSKPLGALLNGPMLEAKEKCALLEDIDDDTFVRFSQYAYTGDYIAADPEILLHSSAIATTHHALNDACPNPGQDDGGDAPLAPAIAFAEPVDVHFEVLAAPEPEVMVDDTWDIPSRNSYSSRDKKKKNQ